MTTMIFIIIVWGWLAVFAAGTKLTMVYRRLTGKLGSAAAPNATRSLRSSAGSATWSSS
jgi:hypothetical protein